MIELPEKMFLKALLSFLTSLMSKKKKKSKNPKVPLAPKVGVACKQSICFPINERKCKNSK